MGGVADPQPHDGAAPVRLGHPRWRTPRPRRYAARVFDAYDTHSAAPEPAPLQVGRLRMRYMLETDDRAGYLCIGVARIAEISADRRVSFEPGWMPPALTCVASPVLAGMLNEVAGMIGTRGNALAARLSAPGAAGVSSYADFLLLQTVNGWQGLFAHWADGASVHPEQLYSAFVQLAGQLATFTDATGRRPGSYSGYRHEDLQHSFAPVIADIGRCLSTDWENSAIPIPLVGQKYGVRVGRITDRKILRPASFVLTAQADMRAQDFRRLFRSQVKIGAFEHLRELVTVAMPGIEIRPLPVAPRALPFHNNSHYFELDRASPHWAQMQASAAFGIHVSGDFPGLQLELWAIRACAIIRLLSRGRLPSMGTTTTRSSGRCPADAACRQQDPLQPSLHHATPKPSPSHPRRPPPVRGSASTRRSPPRLRFWR